MEVRAFDMFCGAGGSSCGARQAGATIVGGVDLWPLATRTFQLNFPKAKVFTATNLVELHVGEVAVTARRRAVAGLSGEGSFPYFCCREVCSHAKTQLGS